MGVSECEWLSRTAFASKLTWEQTRLKKQLVGPSKRESNFNSNRLAICSGLRFLPFPLSFLHALQSVLESFVVTQSVSVSDGHWHLSRLFVLSLSLPDSQLVWLSHSTPQLTHGAQQTFTHSQSYSLLHWLGLGTVNFWAEIYAQAVGPVCLNLLLPACLTPSHIHLNRLS